MRVPLSRSIWKARNRAGDVQPKAARESRGCGPFGTARLGQDALDVGATVRLVTAGRRRRCRLPRRLGGDQEAQPQPARPAG